MTVLTSLPNGVQNKDFRDTVNSVLARLLALEATTTPTLSLSSAVTQAEGNSGSVNFIWTLTLVRNGSTATFPFSWAVTGTGANPANAADFGGTLPSGSGTFASGETAKTITVVITGDTALEPAETFLLTVTAPGLNTVTSTGTISNDDVDTTNNLYVGETDSITAGSLTWAPAYANTSPTIPYNDQSIGGGRITNVNAVNNNSMEGRRAAVLALNPRYISILVGANDLGDSTTYPTLADWQNALLVEINARKAPGRKILLATVLPRQGYTLLLQRRPAANAWIKGLKAQGIIDEVIDLDATIMGLDSTMGNTLYYVDDAHPTALGQSILQNALRGAMNKLRGLPTNVTPFTFQDKNGATAGAVTTADAPIVISGIPYGETRTLTVSGGQVQRTPNGGSAEAWTAGPLTVTSGDSILPRGLANATANGTTNVVVDVEGISDTFTLTTANAFTPLTSTYRGGTTGFDANYLSTFSWPGVAFFPGKNVIALVGSQGNGTGATVKLGGATAAYKATGGGGTITFWEVVKGAGGSGNLDVTGWSGGVRGMVYAIWTVDATAAFGTSKTGYVNYSDPGHSDAITMPQGGKIFGVAVSASSVPTAANVTIGREAMTEANTGISVFFGELPASGPFEVNGVSFSGTNILAVSYAPTQ